MENSLPTLIAGKVLMSSRLELISDETALRNEGLLWASFDRTTFGASPLLLETG
jgi:hypothetical protein